MDVIVDATDSLGNPLEPAHGASEVLVQAHSPRVGDRWLAVFSGEDNVVMETKVGGGHGVPWPLVSFCDPIGIGFDICVLFPVVFDHRLISGDASGVGTGDNSPNAVCSVGWKRWTGNFGSSPRFRQSRQYAVADQ